MIPDGVVEFETAFPWGIVCYTRDQDVDADISSVLLSIASLDRSNVQIPPKQIGIRHRYGNQIAPI